MLWTVSGLCGQRGGEAGVSRLKAPTESPRGRSCHCSDDTSLYIATSADVKTVLHDDSG